MSKEFYFSDKLYDYKFIPSDVVGKPGELLVLSYDKDSKGSVYKTSTVWSHVRYTELISAFYDACMRG